MTDGVIDRNVIGVIGRGLGYLGILGLRDITGVRGTAVLGLRDIVIVAIGTGTVIMDDLGHLGHLGGGEETASVIVEIEGKRRRERIVTRR